MHSSMRTLKWSELRHIAQYRDTIVVLFGAIEELGTNLCYNGDIMTTKRKRIFDQGLSRQKRALRIPTTGPGEDMRDKTRYTRKKKHREKINA